MEPPAIVAGVALATAWGLSVLTGVTPAGAAAETVLMGRRVSDEDAAAHMRKGEDAQRRGDYLEADKSFRLAWNAPSQRRRAAESLARLHGLRRFKTPVNEGRVAETEALLGDRFARYETENFLILSDCDRDWTMAKAGVLESAHHQFFRVMARLEFPVAPAREKLLCVLFREHDAYRAFARAHDNVAAPWIAGYYAALSNRIVFYNDESSPSFSKAMEQLDAHEREAHAMHREANRAKRGRGLEREKAKRLTDRADNMQGQIDDQRSHILGEASRAATAKTVHEAVHLIAFNTGLQSRAHEYPFWVTEGLATSFETDAVRAAFGPDQPTFDRAEGFRRVVRQGEVIPMEELIQITQPDEVDGGRAEIFYAQSYAVFTYLYRYERTALAAYLGDVTAEPPGKISRDRHVELFIDRFGDPGRLERRVVRQHRD